MVSLDVGVLVFDLPVLTDKNHRSIDVGLFKIASMMAVISCTAQTVFVR